MSSQIINTIARISHSYTHAHRRQTSYPWIGNSDRYDLEDHHGTGTLSEVSGSVGQLQWCIFIKGCAAANGHSKNAAVRRLLVLDPRIKRTDDKRNLGPSTGINQTLIRHH